MDAYPATRDEAVTFCHPLGNVPISQNTFQVGLTDLVEWQCNFPGLQIRSANTGLHLEWRRLPDGEKLMPIVRYSVVEGEIISEKRARLL